MADEIVIKYQADISNLQSNLHKVEGDLLSVEKDSKKSMNTLSKESNKAATSIDKVDKQVNSLGSSLSGLLNKLPFAGAVQEINEVGTAVKGVGQSASGASKGMQILRVATTAALGPLLILVGVVVAIIAYFKRTDEGATKLEGIMGALGAVINEVTGFIAELGSQFFDALSSIDGFKQGLSDLGDFLANQVKQRFLAFITLGQAIGKTFRGDFKGALKDAEDATGQFVLGVEHITDKIEAFSERVAKAAKEAYEFALAMDAISDAQRELNVQLSENRIKIVELIRQSKNHSLAIEDRISKLQEANKLDADGLEQTLDLEKAKLKLLKERNEREKASINQKIDGQIKEAKSENEILALQKKRLSINDDLAQEEADQQIKINNLKTESVALQERNNNAIAALIELGIQEELKAEQTKADKKENIQKQSLLNKEINEKQFEENSIQILLDSLEAQKAILVKYGKDTTDIDKAILDVKLKQLNEANKAVIEASKVEKELNDKKLKDEKDAAELQAKNLASIRNQEFEEKKKQIEEEKKLRQQAANEALGIAQNALNAQITLQLAKETNDIASEKAAFDKRQENLIASLDKRKAAGLISEEDYNKQKAKLDLQAAQKTQQLKERQFKAEQNADVNRVKLDTAVAVVKTFATYGFTPAAFLAVGALLANAAIQVSAIRSTPVPKFKDGVIRLNGPGTGTSDSIHAMLSKDESVIKAKQSIKHTDALRSIQDDYFDKYVNQNYVVPAMRKAEARKNELQLRQANTADNIMKALELNGYGDMSHLERLTKSNKKVIVQNMDSLPREIGKELSKAITNKSYMR